MTENQQVNLVPEKCLSITEEIDYASKEVQGFSDRYCVGATDIEKAVSLYYAVRDNIRYDPYQIELTSDGLKASTTIRTGLGWCVSKAILLAATLRHKGIPAALGYADVKNHLSTKRLREVMGTDVFMWHGYTSILLEKKWVKATPAFNIELCKKFRILPLNFNGRADSIYHPFDKDGREHMEYLNYRGEYANVPLEEMKLDFERFYPELGRLLNQKEFLRDVEEED